MTAKARLAHIVLMTRQLPRLRDWYCAVLEAHVVHENPALCFITFDEEHHRLALLSPPGAPLIDRTPVTVGMHHSAYTFDTLDDLLERYARLKRQGIEPLTPIQHGVTTSLYYRDPDGNMVELQIDNFASAEEANAYMSGPEFAADPIGPAFDPQAMLDARQAGSPVAALTTRAWALAGTPMPDPISRMMSPPDTH